MHDRSSSSPCTACLLHTQLLEACYAMLQYAFGAGLKVSATLVQELATIERSLASLEPSVPGAVEAWAPQAADQVAATPPALQIEQQVADFARIHGRLVDLVAPATPRTILLFAREASRGSWWGFLGPVPFMRRMMLTALVCLLAFILIGLSPAVNVQSVEFTILQSSGLPLLLNLLFYLAAAGIGASFAALFQAQQYITVIGCVKMLGNGRFENVGYRGRYQWVPEAGRRFRRAACPAVYLAS